jgi:hypothetical protein
MIIKNNPKYNGHTVLCSILRGSFSERFAISNVARRWKDVGACRCENGNTLCSEMILHGCGVPDIEYISETTKGKFIKFNEKNQDGSYPLFIAAQMNNVDLTEFLIRQGVATDDVVMVNETAKTPIDVATDEVVKTLIETKRFLINVDVDGENHYIKLYYPKKPRQASIDKMTEAVKRCATYIPGTQTSFKFPNGFTLFYPNDDDYKFGIENNFLIISNNGGQIFNEESWKKELEEHKNLDEEENEMAKRPKYKSSLPNWGICMVCMEPLFNPCVNNCGSVYCKFCLKRLYLYKVVNDPAIPNMKMDGKTCIPVDAFRRAMLEYIEE